MWRKSDVKINFKHFKNYFLLPTSAATQHFGLVLLRRCRESSELPDVVPRCNVLAWFCCVAAGNPQNLSDVVPRRNVWAWFCCVAAGNLQNFPDVVPRRNV